MRALVIAHGHPDFSVGGAERAAYDLFEALRDHPRITEATFLARTDRPHVGHGAVSLFAENEYLWRQDMHDWFLLRAANPEGLHEHLRNFLQVKRPDIVYVHHYAHMGLELLRQIRRELPDCFICLTLHEYMAICLNRGQMVKRNNNRLCTKESPEECSLCMGDRSAEDFWLRKHFVQKHFESVNAFVSPSRFLRDAYIRWGISPSDIFVIENGQPIFDLDLAEPIERHVVNRFAFFGQITEFKGVDVLLNAVRLLPPEVRRTFQVEIHGANLEKQDPKFIDVIEKLRGPLMAEGTVRWMGPYEPHELQRRMRKVGWVVVPSIWWENSPMVIQEAFCARRPVIASNIGGMAEKVEHGVTGLHFEARSPVDLADTLAYASSAGGLWERLVGNIRQPPTYVESAAQYLKLAGVNA